MAKKKFCARPSLDGDQDIFSQPCSHVRPRSRSLRPRYLCQNSPSLYPAAGRLAAPFRRFAPSVSLSVSRSCTKRWTLFINQVLPGPFMKTKKTMICVSSSFSSVRCQNLRDLMMRPNETIVRNFFFAKKSRFFSLSLFPSSSLRPIYCLGSKNCFPLTRVVPLLKIFHSDWYVLWSKLANLYIGQWLWHSWPSAGFRHQRSAVQIPTAAKICIIKKRRK